MTTFRDNTENITKRDIKFLIGSFTVITIGTVLGMYIYNDVLKMHWSQRNTLYYNQINTTREHEHMSLKTKDVEEINFPKLELNIITSEYDDSNNTWRPTLKHTFYGNTENEILELVNSHRRTDTFFDASFSGIFKWKDGSIKLKNTVYDLINR